MRIYSKFLLIVLPLFGIALVVTNVLVYRIMRPPLLDAAEQILSVGVEEAQKIVTGHQADLVQKGLLIFPQSVLDVQMEAQADLAQLRPAQRGSVFVLLEDGQTLLLPHLRGHRVETVADNISWEVDADDPTKGLVRLTIKGVPHLGRYAFFEPWGWYLIAADPAQTVYGQADQAFRTAFQIQLSLVAIICLFMVGIIRNVLRPIHALTGGMTRIGQGDLHARIHVDTRDELHDLATGFNHMAAELEATLADLRENEARYRTLFNQANDAIYVVEPHTGRIVDANAKASQMTGYTAAKLHEMVIANLYPAEAGVTTPPNPILNTLRETHQLHQDGHLIPIEGNTTLLTLGGQPFYLTYVRDVSLRKAAEQTLRRREAVLAAVSFAAEQLFISPWEEVIQPVLAKLGEAAQMSRVTLFINQSATANQRETFSLHTEWVIPHLVSIQQDSRYKNVTVNDTHLAGWIQPMSTGQFMHGLVRDLPPAQQQFFHAIQTLAYASFPIIVQGKFWGVLSFSDCLHERPWPAPELDALSTAARTLAAAIQRQQAEKELRWSEERFRLFADNVDQVLWILDINGEMVYVSPAFEQIWGISPQQVYETKPDWLSFVHPDDYERIRVADQQTTLHGFDEIFRIVRPDGSIRWVRDRAFSLHDEQGNLFGEAGIAEDVTEKLAAEEALREAQRMESIGILAGGIAHDFNNLLTSMLGQASLAQFKIGEGHPAHANIFKAMKSAERAADLTRQLLAYAGKGNFQIEWLDLNQLIRENVELLEVALPKQAKLHVELANQLAPVQADKGQMQQVVMNLVINAAESIRAEQGQVYIHTYLAALTEGDGPRCVGNTHLEAGTYVCLRVRDTGIGMGAETQQRIFDPFFSTKEHGRGLGLSATLGIVHTHHGGVVLESEPERGTTFTVYLPVQTTGEVSLAIPPTAVTAAPRSGKVLVIDDEAPVREAVVDILELMEIEVLEAGNGREGVAVYQQHAAEISLVLLDMQMPEMNGPETYLALHQLNPEVRVIISSGYGEAEASRLFSVDGSLTFLQKPYDIERLMHIVVAELGKK